MKILSWMQRRLDRKHGTTKPKSISVNHHMQQETRKEEFSDWPHGLFAIGTFGHASAKNDPEMGNVQGSQFSSQDRLQDISPEVFGELQRELNLLLHKQDPDGSNSALELDIHNLELDNLNRPLSSVHNRTNSDTDCNGLAEKTGHLQRSSSAGLNREIDNRLEHMSSSVIGKKSLYFLLKKAFLCRSGFAPAPAPSLRDPLPQSRMEKIMRAILHKKIYPQNSSPKAATKKYLEHRHTPESECGDDETLDKENAGSKWDKTDSEFIVLEIRYDLPLL